MGNSHPFPPQENRLCDAQSTKFLAWKHQLLPGFFVVNCNGSFRPLDDTVGYGNIIRDHSGSFIFAKAVHLQNDQLIKNDIGSKIDYGIIVVIIEMLAVLDGLRRAQILGMMHVQIQSDSKIGIAIIRGNGRCSRQCLDVYYEILAKLSFFAGVKFSFVYREYNKAADFLSKFLNSEGEQCFSSSELPKELQKNHC